MLLTEREIPAYLIVVKREKAILSEASKYVQSWLRRQPGVKEESLTDWLLDRISSQSPRFHYSAFSRHTEARETGADWEWWLLFPQHSYRLGVQAKKLNANADHYAVIAHVNRYGLQVEMLLENSRKADALPFYAFYSGIPSPTMCEVFDGGDEGVFVAGAHRIFDDFVRNGRRNVGSGDLLLRTTPLSCFFCCPLISLKEGDLLKFLSNYYPEALAEESLNPRNKPVGVYDRVPPFVLSFMTSEDTNVWEREFHQEVNDIKALAVADLRSGADERERND